MRVPHFSPDGRTIAFERRSGGGLTAPTWSDNPGVYRVAASGGVPVRVSKDAASPRFGAANDRLFMVAEKDDKRQLLSTDLNGEAPRVHASGELANDYAISPDGRLVAFRQNYQAYVMPLMPGGQEVEVATKEGALPGDPRQRCRGGLYPLVARRGAAALEHGRDPVHRAVVAALPRRSGRRGRAQVRRAVERTVARDGARGGQAKRHRRR